MKIKQGAKVVFDYVLKVDDQEIESSRFQGPKSYVHGQAEILQPLADQLEGLQAGDQKKIDIPAGKVYGDLKDDHPLKGKTLQYDITVKEVA